MAVIDIELIQTSIIDYLKSVISNCRIEAYPDDDTTINDKVKGVSSCILVKYFGTPNINASERKKENSLYFKRKFYETLLFEIHIGNKSLNNKAGMNATINNLRTYLTNFEIDNVAPLSPESIGTAFRDDNIWWQTLTYSTIAPLDIDFHGES